MHTLLANIEERTLEGLLLPYNEEGSTNLGKLLFAKGTVRIPADPEVVTLNLDHDREQPVGRALSLAETEGGITAVFRIAKTEEGDQLLAKVQKGEVRSLSAEVRGITKRGIAAITGALFGAAVVAAGAFPSAGFFALVEDVTEDPSLDNSEPTDTEPAIDTTEYVARIKELEARLAEVLKTNQTPEDNPSEDPEETPTEEPDSPATNPKEDAVAEATAPNTVTLADKKEEPGATGVFELITTARGGSKEAETMLAALADIKISGTGALPANGVLQPAWLGEVWTGVEPTRRYAPLVKNGSIVALEEKGFRLSTGTELVKSWAGNKAELPTGTATTSIVSGGPLQKWAYAADVAQEFYMIPAGRPVVEAFVREIFRSYARVSDRWVLEQIYAAAGAQVDADTYPGGYNTAIGKLIQGVDTIDDSDIQPSFAIVAPDVYTTLRFTPRDELPEFVNFSAGRQEGTADGVTIIRDKAGVLDAGQVLVGGREFAHVNELPGAPVQIDALDVAHGGRDISVIGMQQWMTEYEDGIVLIGDAPTP
jgi:outer membrane biosynthesis protein TonB